MLTNIQKLSRLSNDALIAATQEIVKNEREATAALVLHLAEIDARGLYRERAHSSLHAFCVVELGLSEDAAGNRIAVARAAIRYPAVSDALRTGRVHLTGLRILAPHLTAANHKMLLDEAAGKPKREVEDLVARFAPKPDVPTMVRKISNAIVPLGTALPKPVDPLFAPKPTTSPARAPSALPFNILFAPPPPPPPPASDDRFRYQFSGDRELKELTETAQALFRHQIPDGDLATLFKLGLQALIEKKKKDRFGIGAKPRAKAATPTEPKPTSSRHVPAAIRRAVYQRDQGRCTYVDSTGRRCDATHFIELEHKDGFARTQLHSVDSLCLLCRAHNQHQADKMYGRRYMDRARRRKKPYPPRGGSPTTDDDQKPR